MSGAPTGPEDIVRPDLETTQAEGWWGGYRSRLAASSMTATAQQVVELDSRYIVERGIHGAGLAGEANWPTSRHRSGLVMGAVQSGKTASMLGVAGMALDAGIDIIVVLAGTRIALWRQTYDRITRQLDGYAPSEEFARSRARILAPPPRLMVGPESPPPHEMYQLSGAQAERALRARRPIVMVVMKQVHHLRTAAKALHTSVYPRLGSLDRPVHMLVLDDEADDGSILDAVIEQDMDPAVDALKQIPRHIVDLWATRGQPDETAAPNLFATYLSYTATPQANLLQADQNPLAPRDFATVLRTPFESGTLDPRSTTYREPKGFRRYYTGGEIFYGRIAGPEGLLVRQPPALANGEYEAGERRRWIAEALRSYLVAGAVRLWQAPGRSFMDLADARFESLDDLRDVCPSPHSMLFHPSGAVLDQFTAGAEVLEWAGGLDAGSGSALITAGVRSLPADAVAAQLMDDEEPWACWLDRFHATAVKIGHEFDAEPGSSLPGRDDWPAIRDLLITEVIPNVRLAIINSDPDADDRPEFEPQLTEAGLWRAPNDVFTVFVSGNVMARGLTLEGLTTTLFLRQSTDPLADIQMQMQRWFGYRGPYLELCRVFVPSEQADLFVQYHEADEALRLQVVSAMNDAGAVAPLPTVIEGERFRATGKIAGITKVPLCPGRHPFVTLVNDEGESDPNMSILRDLFIEASEDVVVNNSRRGRLLGRTISLTEAAELLERFRYRSYVPDPSDPFVTRWSSVAAQVGLNMSVDGAKARLFNAPAPQDAGVHQPMNPRRCPYAVAAYLRLWDACLSRRVRGMFPTDNGEVPWSNLDLEARRAEAPRFHVAIKYGGVDELAAGADPALSGLDFSIRPMGRAVGHGNLTSAWGSQGVGDGLPDELFDYYRLGATRPVEVEGRPGWRRRGEPGLILLHPVKAVGVDHLVLAVGVAIPLGGPDHFAARPEL